MRRRGPDLIALGALLPLAGLTAQRESVGESGVVEVTARDFAFEAPAEIPSGWTAFRMENAGQQEHFLFSRRLPEGKTLEDYITAYFTVTL